MTGQYPGGSSSGGSGYGGSGYGGSGYGGSGYTGSGHTSGSGYSYRPGFGSGLVDLLDDLRYALGSRHSTATATPDATVATRPPARPVPDPVPAAPPKPVKLPTIHSWSGFLRLAGAPPTLTTAASRESGNDSWAGAGWKQALELARTGWTETVPSVDVVVADLRTRMADRLSTDLKRTFDVAGSEVDVAAYLSGVPECMLEVEPRTMSRHGRVVTLLVPAGCEHTVDRKSIMNRGRALCALCCAVVGAGHSVDVWSGHAFQIGGARHHAVARVVAAGEPFDPARLMFAVAHPAMLRRLWFGVWDGQGREIAARLRPNDYGLPPFECRSADLPEEITDSYVLPYLDGDDDRWADPDAALAWAVTTFAELGLVTR